MKLPTLPKLSQVPRAERYAALTGLIVSVILTTAKFWAYYLTSSAAIFSDALESIVNVVAGLFALYALALSHEPADESHPYGHGKVEFLSAALEGGMVFFAGVGILFHAITSFLAGPHVTKPQFGAVLLAIAAVVNLVVGAILVRIGKRRHSLTLEADGKHLLSDVVTSGGVLIALFLVWKTGLGWIDPACAAIVAIYLFITGLSILRQSTAGLMDEQDVEDDEIIRKLLDAHVSGVTPPRICSYHKLRHRHTGRMHWVDFHLLVPAEMTVFEGHRIAGVIEYEIEQALVEADATAHIEPCPGCERCAAPGDPS